MLIWLASYPRSGNTLLRQVLWRTLGLASYDAVSHRSFMGEWALDFGPRFGTVERLREAAVMSGETMLVKTHLPPSDGERAIYVVRDGRSAISSFLRHERRHSPESEQTLIRLILADHFYGGWSQHVQAWLERPGETLLVRFADLRDADEATTARLAGFVGHAGTVAPWLNPLEEYRRLAPDEFGDASVRWEPSEEWDWLADVLFWAEHGEVMERLGYDDGRRIGPPVDASLSDVLGLAGLARSFRERVRELQAELGEKEELLRRLDAERSVQASAARERAALIEVLSAELERLRAQLT